MASHDEGEDGKEWFFRSRKLPDPRLLSNYALDHGGPSSSQSQRPGYQAQSSQEVGSSGRAIIDTTYVLPRPITLSPHDSHMLTQGDAPNQLDGGQAGMKRLYTPTVQFTTRSGLDSAGTTLASNSLQALPVDWPNKTDIQAQIPAGSSQYTRPDYTDLGSPGLGFDYDIEMADRGRHVKRTRRVQASAITSSIETRELEEQCE